MKKNIEKESLEPKKVIGTIIGIVIFIGCALFFTYAWYEWRSSNTEFSVTISEKSTECLLGPDISISNIGPVLNIADGVKVNFSINNKSSGTLNTSLSLNIQSISEALKVESFKYALVQDPTGGTSYDYSTPVISGNFKNLVVGNNELSSTISLAANSSYAFQFIVYIDGAMPNNENMMESSMNASLTIGDCNSSKTLLAKAEPGSYVKYVGSNGCTGKACEGQNANYVDDTDMGYCNSSSNKYKVNSWRVGYVKDGSAYLVSAGAPECVQVYGELKSSTTTSKDFVNSSTYLVSTTGTMNSSTSTFSLGATKNTYSFPTDLSSMNNTFTCGNATDTSCTTPYRILVDNDMKSLTLEKYSTGSCTSSTNPSDPNYENCKIIDRVYWSSGTSVAPYPWGTSYELLNGGFSLSGSIIDLYDSYLEIGKYTCLEWSTSSCSKLYYTTGEGHSTEISEPIGDGVTRYTTSYYASYTFQEFTYYNSYFSLNTNYVFGAGYTFDAYTGKYTLVDSSTLNWGSDYNTVIGGKKYTCWNSTGKECDTMYEVTSDSSNTSVVYYTYTSMSSGSDDYINALDARALKYCNPDYAYGGVCNSDSAWAIDNNDFEQITGSPLYSNSSGSSCYREDKSSKCGYKNDLINNGGNYWFASNTDDVLLSGGIHQPMNMYWYMYKDTAYVHFSTTHWSSYGVRPVLRIASDIVVVGGTGTYADPYLISKPPTLATEHVVNKYNDGSALTTVNIGGDTSKPTVTQNATQGIMLDNNGEYRYYGANPNNYVTFNGELWRIISVSNVKSSTTDTTGEMRMKIIRNESIGNYSYDSSESAINDGYGVNDWSKADLNVELNTLYLNQRSGNCYNERDEGSTTCDFTTIGLSEDARNMVDDALWYLGASGASSTKYANDYYSAERGTTTYDCSTDDRACPRVTSWVGKIGLMYPSDYVYASDQSLCTATANSWNNSANSACITNDWLYGITQWTISPDLSSSGAVGVYYAGDVYNIVARAALGVRPVLVLKSNVNITSGNGTESNPYQLSVGS